MKKVLSLYICVIIICSCILITGCNKAKVIDVISTDVISTEFIAGNKKIELEKISILSDKVDILIPKSFYIMSEEMAEYKYPSENRPTLIYTNDDGSINIAFNHTQSRTKYKDIPSYTNYLIKSFKNSYPSAQFYQTGVKIINGKKVGIIEVLTPAVDTEIYNLLWFTDLDGLLLMATFNCVKEEMTDWEPIAESIMLSQFS